MNSIPISMRMINKIGLGTAAIGRPSYINIRKKQINNTFDRAAFFKKGIQLLESAYKQGINYFDTAPGYGIAEQMVIDWINDRNDKSIELATKWGYTYVANFNPSATQHEVKEHSLTKLNEQWEQSKILLPALTTYQIHSVTIETGVLDNEAILKRLLELKNEYNLIIGLNNNRLKSGRSIKKSNRNRG